MLHRASSLLGVGLALAGCSGGPVAPAAPAAPTLPACPSSADLLGVVGPAMLAHAPAGVTWSGPSVALCAPVGLPQPAWYVVGSVQQDSPDRGFRFHLVVDAATKTIVASSDGEQRSSHEACTVKLAAIEPHPGAASTVVLRDECVDKMGKASAPTLAATIHPPAVELAPR